MAVQESRDTRTFIAGEDLSSSQFKFVTLESDGQVDLADSAGENCMGVVINDPASGGEATVVVSGKTVVTAGGTIAAGASIATDASGDAVTASTGNIVMGYALEAGVDGQVIAVELIQGGNAAA
jgi:hypothetical protein